MNATRVRVLLVAIALALPAGHALAANAFAEPVVRRGEGVVHAVDFTGPYAVVSGLRYGFTVDAEVEIGESFGAPTMLVPGMRVVFEFEESSDAGIAGRIRWMAELAPDTTLSLH